MNDDDLDRAVGSLTDVSPSPAVKANVMRRIAEASASGVRRSEGPKVRESRTRLALAAAALVLVAVASWFALKPAPPHQTAGRRTPAPAVAPLPRTGGEGVQATPEAEAPRVAVRTRRAPASRHETRSPSGVETAEPLEPVDALSPAMPPIEIRPIPDSDPVLITPVTVKPLEIPEIQIPPVDDTTAKGNAGKK